MKNLLFLGLLAFTLGACRKDAEEEVQPDYADWYALRAPDNRAIEAVSGDIDGTLVITTGFKIYQTKDRGKTWLTANYNERLGLTGFLQRNDTLLVFTSQLGSALPTSIAYAAQPEYYSIDGGAQWQPYRNWDRKNNFSPRIARNQATSPLSGTEYSIDILLTPINPGTSSSYVETVGIMTTAGRKLTLPQAHQIQSIYFDAKSRLYVAASAALCGRNEKFAFCGEQNGVLYVSKEPQL
jgi:hypothetical protein